MKAVDDLKPPMPRYAEPPGLRRASQLNDRQVFPKGEWERHSGRRPARAEKRVAHCAASSRAVLIEDAEMRATRLNILHAASCH